MVDGIAGKGQHTIQESGLPGLNSQQAVEKVNSEAGTNSANVVSLELLDKATISDSAKSKLEREKDALRFGRLAQRVQEPDNAKVAYLKDLLDNNRINEYLRNVDTDALAQSLLASPSGAFLR